jgi:hypothetical protein
MLQGTCFFSQKKLNATMPLQSAFFVLRFLMGAFPTSLNWLQQTTRFTTYTPISLEIAILTIVFFACNLICPLQGFDCMFYAFEGTRMLW